MEEWHLTAYCGSPSPSSLVSLTNPEALPRRTYSSHERLGGVIEPSSNIDNPRILDSRAAQYDSAHEQSGRGEACFSSWKVPTSIRLCIPSDVSCASRTASDMSILVPSRSNRPISCTHDQLSRVGGFSGGGLFGLSHLPTPFPPTLPIVRRMVRTTFFDVSHVWVLMPSPHSRVSLSSN